MTLEEWQEGFDALSGIKPCESVQPKDEVVDAAVGAVAATVKFGYKALTSSSWLFGGPKMTGGPKWDKTKQSIWELEGALAYMS